MRGCAMASNSPPDPWPPPEIAAQLDQPSPHDPWPPPDLDAALKVGEGTTQLGRALTAAESAGAYRPKYSASAAEAYPGSP